MQTAYNWFEDECKVLLPTRLGNFTLWGYKIQNNEQMPMILSYGNFQGTEDLLVRIHSECLTGEVFGSTRCECGPQLEKAMSMIVREGKGIIIYLRQEGRGIGLYNKFRAYTLQDKGLNTIEANTALGFQPDERNYELAYLMLKRHGVNSIRLITNNPSKILSIKELGIKVNERVPLEIEPCKDNLKYLEVKKKQMGHYLTVL